MQPHPPLPTSPVYKFFNTMQTRSSRPNKSTRGGNFSRDEIDALLDCVEDVLPIGLDEWARVEQRHLVSYPDRNWNKESLRCKFQMLYLIKQPTGAPECPPEVRRAKALQNAIRDKAEVSSAGMSSSSDDSTEEEESEEAPEDGAASTINNEPTATAQDQPSVTAGVPYPATARAIPRKFSMPVSRVGSKRKKRSDDADDDVSMKDLIKLAMIQQQESRDSQQTMLQMMSMTMMTMVNANNPMMGQMMSTMFPRNIPAAPVSAPANTQTPLTPAATTPVPPTPVPAAGLATSEILPTPAASTTPVSTTQVPAAPEE